jgi:hypothetical protein
VQIPPLGKASSARFEQLRPLNVLLQAAIQAVEFKVRPARPGELAGGATRHMPVQLFRTLVHIGDGVGLDAEGANTHVYSYVAVTYTAT